MPTRKPELAQVDLDSFVKCTQDGRVTVETGDEHACFRADDWRTAAMVVALLQDQVQKLKRRIEDAERH